MALFNFSKRTQAFEDFDENISSVELLNRLKFIFTNVTDLGDAFIRIEDLAIDIWHEKGSLFIFEAKFELPDFMQNASDDDIIKFCNEINNQKLITCYFYKTDDSIRVLAFRNAEFFIRNIAEINQLVIAFSRSVDMTFKDLEKKFGKNENNSQKDGE
jgi:hypothetical protein